MGWWLTNNKTKAKRKPAKRNTRRGEPDPARRARMLRATTWALVIGGIVVGGWFAQTRLADHVAQQRGARVVVELQDAPTWLGEQRLAPMRAAVAQAASDNPLDQASLQRAVDALTAEPWVDAVRQIRRDDHGRIIVTAAYRQPVALVGARDGFHLVDKVGHRLPGVYAYQELKMLGLPAITGVRAAPPTEGEVWTGEDVRAGIVLAMRLAGEPFFKQVRGIDVANHRGRAKHGYPHITLITAKGAVRWGRAVGAEEIYEPPADQKLAMLRQVHGSYGSIDAGGQVVDVYLDAPMIHAAANNARYTSGRE